MHHIFYLTYSLYFAYYIHLTVRASTACQVHAKSSLHSQRSQTFNTHILLSTEEVFQEYGNDKLN
jgi:hypothetical protein